MAPLSEESKNDSPSSPLHDAIKAGSITSVMKLLSKSTCILETDTAGNSPLHLAFINKNLLITDMILKKILQTSKYTNIKNQQGLSHLHVACTRGMGKIVEGFLNAGANPNETVSKESTSWAGFTAAHFAIAFKSLEALKVLTAFGIDKQIKNEAGETPSSLAYQYAEDWLIMMDLLENNSSKAKSSKSLSNFHMACLTKDDKVVKNFIDHGVNVNTKTSWKMSIAPSTSALHCAVLTRNLEKVQLLMKNGANLDLKNFDKMTALHLAFYTETPLEEGKDDSVRIVDLLYKAVEDKTSKCIDKYGLSYFHIAITRNDLSTVKTYLDNGKVDINKSLSYEAPKFSKYTPLQLAVQYQYPEIVELLVQRGANVNTNSKKRPETALYMACEMGHIDFIELFLKNGAKVNGILNEHQETMLHQITGHCDVVSSSRLGDMLFQSEKCILLYIEQLVRLGIDVNAKDVDGETAMHLVTIDRDKNIKYFQLLLDLGADINLENNQGLLPFNLNTEKQERQISKACGIFYHHVQKLKALGVKIHPKNEECCKFIIDKKFFKDEELTNRQQQRSNEILKMKNLMIGTATSLFDFLNFDVRRAALFADCKALENIANDEKLKEKYPSYAYLIQLQYRKAIDNLQGQNLILKRSGSNTGKVNTSKRRRYV